MKHSPNLFLNLAGGCALTCFALAIPAAAWAEGIHVSSGEGGPSVDVDKDGISARAGGEGGASAHVGSGGVAANAGGEGGASAKVGNDGITVSAGTPPVVPLPDDTGGDNEEEPGGDPE